MNNNFTDFLVKSKYGNVLQTVLYQENNVFFEFQKGASTPETPLPGCATG